MLLICTTASNWTIAPKNTNNPPISSEGVMNGKFLLHCLMLWHSMNPNILIPPQTLRELCEKYSVRELSLFGSALRDDFNAASDIDLLVEFLPDARITFPKLLHLEKEFAVALGRRVDLVPKDGLRYKMREEVLAEAQVVYAV
jgi:predicted nucleotidyltransferase